MKDIFIHVKIDGKPVHKKADYGQIVVAIKKINMYLLNNIGRDAGR